MRILITGGAGFIGSHTSRVLLAQGHEVTIFDNLAKGRLDHVPPGASLIKGDVGDEALLERSLAGHDAVIHLAALIAAGVSVHEPLGFVENNVVNTVRVLEAMRRAGVKRLVFPSSATVYGVPKHLPLDEDEPLGIQSNPYGATKLSCEAFIAVYNQLHGFDATILRYFNAYGPNELCDPETHIVPNVVTAVLERRPIPLYWKGDQIRDFVYVEDIARAQAAVLQLSGLNYFNVGSDTGTKISEVVERVIRIVGHTVPIEDLGERPGDVPATYATSTKLRMVTGWAPQVELDEGLRRTVAHYRERLGSE